MPSEIQGEPVCPDFQVGANRQTMRGSLRLPVVLTIHDGKTPVSKTFLTGRRIEKDTGTHTLLADDNVEYTVEWAQCENERAPRLVGPDRSASRTDADTIGYQCGTATAYKTDTLVTRKGDVASHKLVFVPPPKPECWVSELPQEAGEGAPDAGAPADAGEQATSSATEAAAAAGADGGAADAAAAEPAVADAGLGDAAAAPAGATKKKAGKPAPP
jgi:hypothetical protein